MQRRTVLTLTGALLLAGCLGSTGRYDSPESVVEAYYDADDEADVAALMHTSARGYPDPPGHGVAFEPTDDPEVIDEGLDASDLDGVVTVLGDDALETIAEGETARVRVSVEAEATAGDETVEAVADWIVAKEDDEWTIVGEAGVGT